MKVVGTGSSENQSPLERLARRFHQDFGLEGVDAQTGAAQFLSGQSLAERGMLKQELTAFLADHPGRSNKGITNAWRKLGADWWPRAASTREVITEILGMI